MIYVLDDDGFHVELVKKAFPGQEVLHFTDSVGFINSLKKAKDVDLVVIDLWIDKGPHQQDRFLGTNPRIEGILVAEQVRKLLKNTPIVLSTRFATHEIFMRAKYLNITPLEIPEDYTVGIQKFKELFPYLSFPRNSGIFEEFKNAGFVTESPKMLEILRLVYKWKDLDEPILITGETGTGKDTLAKAIHKLSNRQSSPFINFVISAYPRENLYAKLFGIKKGAFTGVEGSPGVLESVGDGTIVLNEIGDLSVEAQIELLQVIEDRIFYRMQSHKPIKFKGRFIFLTNKDVEQMVEQGGFRKDLYRRIMGFHVHIPPLRERKEDIPVLIEHFAPELRFTDTAMKHLTSNFEYPENVGSLHKIILILRSLLTDRNTVTLDDVIKAISYIHKKKVVTTGEINGDELPDIVLDYIISRNLTIKDFEQLLMDRAYAKFGQTWKKETWGKLGIPRTTFYRKRGL